MNLLEPITLVIKAPNHKIADQTVECALDWTIRKLKTHLSDVYPSQPKEHQQRIIYSGKLLQDEMQLKDILRQIEEERTHTVHLVCSTPDPLPTNTMANTEASQTEGLRHRHTATTSVSSSTSSPVSSSLSSSSLSSSSVTSSSSSTTQSEPQQPTPGLYGAAPGVDAMAGFGPDMAQAAYMAQIPGLMPGFSYSPEQMLWLQQMYTQQMAQYMQYYQQGAVPPPVNVTPSHDQPAANQNAPAAQPANQQAERNPNMVMNAAGEAVMEDDDNENMNRDWLDWLYTFSRFGVLLSIVYFYSTFGRFLMVLGFFMLIYMYQGGWFRVNRQQQRERQAQRERQEAQQNEENARREDSEHNDDPAPEDPDSPAPDNAPAPEPALGVLRIAFSFIMSFFTSLMPAPPPPVNLN